MYIMFFSYFSCFAPITGPSDYLVSLWAPIVLYSCFITWAYSIGLFIHDASYKYIQRSSFCKYTIYNCTCNAHTIMWSCGGWNMLWCSKQADVVRENGCSWLPWPTRYQYKTVSDQSRELTFPELTPSDSQWIIVITELIVTSDLQSPLNGTYWIVVRPGVSTLSFLV